MIYNILNIYLVDYKKKYLIYIYIYIMDYKKKYLKYKKKYLEAQKVFKGGE
jgi:hypothetical protein